MIYLIGPMASGKSTIGRSLAIALSTDFADTDAVITEAHGPIPQIFATHGESYFRSLEAQAVAQTRAGVIATGGGIVVNPQNHAALRRGTVIYLELSERTAQGRLPADDGRPLLSGDDRIARWTQLYEQRRTTYESLADLTVNVDDRTVDEVVALIKDHVIRATR